MLRVSVRNFGNVAIFYLQGRIVRGESEALRDAFIFQRDVKTVILDFGGVNLIDAGGLGLMLELRSVAQSKGMGFKLANVSRIVSRILEITRLDSVFEIEPRADSFLALPHRVRPTTFAACA